MNSKYPSLWFRIVSVILVLWGIIFAVFGLKVLPVRREVLLDWETALYGAILMGWGVTLVLAGRHAFQKKDKELMKILLLGISVWLLVEAFFSAYLHVWFNVGVDVGVFLLFSAPLVNAIRRPS